MADAASWSADSALTLCPLVCGRPSVGRTTLTDTRRFTVGNGDAVGGGYGFINPYPLFALGWLMEARLARLRWRCRRGMRELDSLLLRFVDGAGTTLGETELMTFEAILELPDPVLHSYLLGRSAPTDAATVDLIERIRAAVGADA